MPGARDRHGRRRLAGPDRPGRLDAYGDDPQVQVSRQANGGKASALNFGIGPGHREIVVCLDADTQFEPDTIATLVAPLADARVGAVAGNAKVGNRINLVTRWQALEYITVAEP